MVGLMGTEWSPAKKRRQARKRRAEEERWAARSHPVIVQTMCVREDCDGSCGDWHRW